jgi:hypothetical protein
MEEDSTPEKCCGGGVQGEEDDIPVIPDTVATTTVGVTTNAKKCSADQLEPPAATRSRSSVALKNDMVSFLCTSVLPMLSVNL